MEDAVDLIKTELENIEKNHNNLDILIVKLILLFKSITNVMPDFICKQISKKSKKFYNELYQNQMSFQKKYHLEMQIFVCIDTVVIQLTTRFVDLM